MLRGQKLSLEIDAHGQDVVSALSTFNVGADTVLLQELQFVLRKRVNGVERPLHVFGMQQEKMQLLELLKTSICFGEGNSLLIIGPRGCGKTLLLDTTLECLQNDRDVQARGFLTVKLNGLLHMDDKVALKEISRQLHISLDSGEGMSSIAETVSQLISALHVGKQQTTQCILFILDEFDLFAHTGKQTLLYTLFDSAQQPNTPIAVVGLTCRYDVLSLLEKRVLSRFSRRQIHLFTSITFEQYQSIFQDLLTLNDDFSCNEFARSWNAHVAQIIQKEVVRRELRTMYDCSRDIRVLQRFASLPLYHVIQSPPRFVEESFFETAHSQKMVICTLFLLI